MAIRDVSKNWAMMLESEEVADKRYGDACERACKKIEELEQQELNDIDEVEVDPVECGFSEEEVTCNEVVDPLEMWKTIKAEQKPTEVKVDAAYIETMRKLLSRIRSSKSQLYDSVMKKLAEYRKRGTTLPPPEDFAENFIPFEQIQKTMSSGKTKEERDAAKAKARMDAEYAKFASTADGDSVKSPDDEEDDGVDADDDTENLRKSEYDDVDNVYGNDMADQNLYDSELTESEEKESKSKAVSELKKVQSISSSKLADEFKSSKSKIEKAISSIKSEKTKDDLKKLMKLAEKYVNGELEESDEACLEEASSKKSSKKTKTGSFIAGVLKFLIWIGIVGVGTVAAGAWVISKIGSVASVMVKGMQDVSRRLSESIALECADDAQQLEEADAEELDECGNPVEDSSPAAMVHQGKSIAEWAKLFKGEFSVSQLARMALSGTDLGQLLLAADGISDIYDSEKPEDMNEADYREKASHLLDPVGVKASTASLKAQDTAMISVVETLLKKIDRLEEKVDASKKRDVETDEAEEQVREARERDLSKVDKSVTNCLMQHISELTPQVMQDQKHAADVVQGWFDEAGIDTPKSREYVTKIRFFPEFQRVGAIIQFLTNTYLAGCGLRSTSAGARSRRMMYSSDDGANGTNALTPEEFFGEAEDDEDAESSVEKKSEVNAGDVIPVNDATPAQIENAKREFKYGLDKLSPEDLAEVMNNVFGRIAVSLQRQELAGGGPDVEHDRKEVEKAFRRMKALIQKDRDNFAMKDPETQKDIMHGLTAEEREEFANLVYRYWYDWLRAAKKTEDGEIVEVPLMQIKDWLSTPDMEIRKDPKTGELKYKTNAQFVGPGYSYMPIGVGYDTAFRTRDENGTLRQPAVVWKEKPLKTDIKRAERIASKEKQDAIDRGEYAPEEIDTLVNTWKKTFGPVSKKVRQSIEKELKDEEVYGGVPMSDKDKADFISAIKSKGSENAFIQWLFNMFEEPEYATTIKNFKSDVKSNYWKSKVQRLKDAVKAKTKEIDDKVADAKAEYQELQKETGDLTPEQQEKHAAAAERMADAWDEQQLWSEVLENMRTGSNADVTTKLLSRFGIDLKEMFKKDLDELKDIKTGDFDIKTVSKWIDRPHDLALDHRTLAPLFNMHSWVQSGLSQYERYTIAMIVTAIAKATGKHPLEIDDWQKEVAQMSQPQYAEFIKTLADYVKSRPRRKDGLDAKMTDQDIQHAKEYTSGLLAMIKRAEEEDELEEIRGLTK